MKSVLLIDDHPIVALGLRLALAGHARLHLVGSATDANGGLLDVATLRPDRVVLDLVLAGSIDLGNVAEVRALLPGGVIVVFSSLPMRSYARDALAAGADAFLGKSADMDELVALLDRPRSDHRPDGADARSRDAASRHEALATIDGVPLTPRELGIAAAIGRGQTNEVIAARLALSPNTVAAHRDNIRRKLGCGNSKELVACLARLADLESRAPPARKAAASALFTSFCSGRDG